MSEMKKGWSQPVTWANALYQSAVFLAFAIPFVWLIGMIVGAWSIKGELGTAADWMQAIGSLIGIGIAIAVPAWQRRHEQEDQRKQARRLLIDSTTALRSLLTEQALIVDESLRDLCGDDGWHLVMQARTQKHIRALDFLAGHAAMAGELGLLSLGPEHVGYVIDYRQRAAVLGRISRVQKVSQLSPSYDEEYELFSSDLRQLELFQQTLRELDEGIDARLEFLEKQG